MTPAGASLLTVAAIGIAVALERCTLAVSASLLVLCVLRGVRWIELGFNNPRRKPPLDRAG